MDTCKDCKHWVSPQAEDGRYRQCRRNAPKLFQIGENLYRGTWPITGMDDFCGDFERKEPKGEQG